MSVIGSCLTVITVYKPLLSHPHLCYYKATDDVKRKDNAMADEQTVLTVSEAAKIMRISVGSCYAAIGANEIPHVRVGTRILISRAKLMAWLGTETAAAPGG